MQSQTNSEKSLSSQDHEVLAAEFQKRHADFKHTNVTKKLLPVKFRRMLNKILDEVYHEKIQKVLASEPYLSAGYERIFRDDRLRAQLESDSELDEDDFKVALERAKKKVASSKFPAKLLAKAEVLTNPDKFANAFFLGDCPELKKLAMRELKEESDANRFVLNYKGEKSFVIKLLLTSLHDYEYEDLDWKTKVKMRVANLFQKWGMNHAGLQIGPYICDWNTSSLIIPRCISSKHAKALIPLNENLKLDKEKSVKAISRIICDWNSGWSYANCLKLDKEKKIANCQHFVDVLLKDLGLTPHWLDNGPIRKYLNAVSEGSVGSEIKLQLPGGGKFTISSHSDLRNYFDKIAVHPELIGKQQLQEEYMALIKCVERSFQLKHLGDKEHFPAIIDPIFGDVTGRPSRG